MIKRLIRDDAETLLIWTEVTKRPQGQRTDLVDNIHEVAERPSGTSIEAGLRKLQKAATEGNENAARELAMVVAGEKKFHAACVDSGIRKSTKIDPDVVTSCGR